MPQQPAREPLSKAFIEEYFSCCCLRQWVTAKTNSLRRKVGKWDTLGNRDVEQFQQIPRTLECSCTQERPQKSLRPLLGLTFKYPSRRQGQTGANYAPGGPHTLEKAICKTSAFHFRCSRTCPSTIATNLRDQRREWPQKTENMDFTALALECY